MPTVEFRDELLQYYNYIESEFHNSTPIEYRSQIIHQNELYDSLDIDGLIEMFKNIKI